MATVSFSFGSPSCPCGCHGSIQYFCFLLYNTVHSLEQGTGLENQHGTMQLLLVPYAEGERAPLSLTDAGVAR